MIETVKVKHNGDYMIINKADFDESKHQLYEDEKEKSDIQESVRGGDEIQQKAAVVAEEKRTNLPISETENADTTGVPPLDFKNKKK